MKLLYVVMKADGFNNKIEVIKTFTNRDEAVNCVRSTREQLEADGNYDDCVVDYELICFPDGNTSIYVVMFASNFQIVELQSYDNKDLAKAYADGCNKIFDWDCSDNFTEVVEIKDPDGTTNQ